MWRLGPENGNVTLGEVEHRVAEVKLNVPAEDVHDLLAGVTDLVAFEPPPG